MRRFLRALAVALLLMTAGRIIGSMADVPDICASLTPDNWFLWWLNNCGKDSSGGGGSGAGAL